MKNLFIILLVVFLAIAGCSQSVPASTKPASTPLNTPAPTSTPQNVPASPVTTPSVPATPVVPAEKPTSYESTRYTNDTYGFSIRYPKTWNTWEPPLNTNVLIASATPQQPDKLAVCIDIRPATNFNNAACDLVGDLITWKASVTPPQESFHIDSESSTMLADGKTRAYDVCWAVANYKVYCYGILKDGKAIIVTAGWDDGQSTLYKEIVHTLTYK